MSARFALALPALTLSVLLGTGCAHGATVTPPAAPLPQTTSGPATPQTPAPTYSGAAVSISGELIAACSISLNDPEPAPKFDFDKSALLAQDRTVLDQIASCVTTGPLKGRSLTLVGRADQRGDEEYNFVLGEHRAGTVEGYLTHLGVDQRRLVETSRGKLDATGTDEAGRQRDRRVDIVLR